MPRRPTPHRYDRYDFKFAEERAGLLQHDPAQDFFLRETLAQAKRLPQGASGEMAIVNNSRSLSSTHNDVRVQSVPPT